MRYRTTEDQTRLYRSWLATAPVRPGMSRQVPVDRPILSPHWQVIQFLSTAWR